MIIVGNGALAKRAIEEVQKVTTVDALFSASKELEKYCLLKGIPFYNKNINEFSNTLHSITEDKIVLSTNNGWILKSQLLSLEGFHFFNIHNGITPYYRGRPEVCILFAILNSEAKYGVTLHKIDRGIDTGDVLDISTFSIDNLAFHEVMTLGIEECHNILVKNLHGMIQKSYVAREVLHSEGKCYSYRDLPDVFHKTHDEEQFKKACNLGVYKLLLPTFAKELGSFI